MLSLFPSNHQFDIGMSMEAPSVFPVVTEDDNIELIVNIIFGIIGLLILEVVLIVGWPVWLPFSGFFLAALALLSVVITLNFPFIAVFLTLLGLGYLDFS